MVHYIVRRSPHDQRWYVLGSAVQARNRVKYLPVSYGFAYRAQADERRALQIRADAAARRELLTKGV